MGPMLLEGQRSYSDLADILADMPEKAVADKLISRYFNSAEPAIGAFALKLANKQVNIQ